MLVWGYLVEYAGLSINMYILIERQRDSKGQNI